MFAPSNPARVLANGCPRTIAYRPVRRSFGGGGSLITRHHSLPQRERVRAPRPAVALREGGFTLLELLIVVGIIGLLMVLIAPAFTYIKGGTDVTSAAYTIKGVLDTARTYAKANNTYTWVGFYEEDVSQPSVIPAPDPQCTGCVGRLVMSVVASKDGTNVYGSSNGTIDPTKLTQVGKLTKLENIHLPLFAVCQSNCTGVTFDTRPAVQNDPGGGYNYSLQLPISGRESRSDRAVQIFQTAPV